MNTQIQSCVWMINTSGILASMDHSTDTETALALVLHKL